VGKREGVDGGRWGSDEVRGVGEVGSVVPRGDRQEVEDAPYRGVLPVEKEKKNRKGRERLPRRGAGWAGFARVGPVVWPTFFPLKTFFIFCLQQRFSIHKQMSEIKSIFFCKNQIIKIGLQKTLNYNSKIKDFRGLNLVQEYKFERNRKCLENMICKWMI
jgi:hypothetical protein